MKAVTGLVSPLLRRGAVGVERPCVLGVVIDLLPLVVGPLIVELVALLVVGVRVALLIVGIVRFVADEGLLVNPSTTPCNRETRSPASVSVRVQGGSGGEPTFGVLGVSCALERVGVAVPQPGARPADPRPALASSSARSSRSALPQVQARRPRRA